MKMTNENQPHILSASTNLIGICFVLITGLKLAGANEQTFADEICVVAALGFMSSSILSYLSMKRKKESRYESVADYIFIFSLVTLFFAVLIFARGVL